MNSILPMRLCADAMFQKCEDEEPSEENSRILRDMIKYVMLHSGRGKDGILALSANMLGIPKRLAIVRNEHGKWDAALNPYLIEKTGDPVDRPEKSLIFKDQRIRVLRYPSIKVTFEQLKGTGSSPGSPSFIAVDKEYSMSENAPQCCAWQHVCEALDGVKWEMVPHDHLTFKNKDAQPERNAPCPCGSNLKFKKCCGK